MHAALFLAFQDGRELVQLVKNNFILILAIIFILIFTMLIIIADDINISAIVFIVASLSATFYLISRTEEPYLKYCLLIALILRTSLALVQVYTNIDLPGAGKDAIHFELLAWEYARLWLAGEKIIIDLSIYYYSAFVAIFYYLFGRFEIIPLLLNVYMSLIVIVLVYKVTMKITLNEKASKIAVLIFLILPTHHFFSAVLLRDTTMILFLTLAFYYLVMWIDEGKMSYMFYSFLALAGGGVMHGHLFLLLWVNLIILLIYVPQEKRFRINFKQIILIIVILGLSTILVGKLINYQIVFSGYPLTVIFNVDFIRGAIEGKYTNISRTLFLVGMLPYNYFDILWQTPVRIFFFLLSPFPWAIKEFSDLFFFSDVILYSFLIILFFPGLKRLLSQGRYLVAAATFALCISLLVLHAWGTTSYGTAWRHRQKMAPYLVPIASVVIASWGLSEKNVKRKRLMFLFRNDK
jgi:4-amino-4-deoxy-L-arabinose transferase-like glycosyltransferase